MALLAESGRSGPTFKFRLGRRDSAYDPPRGGILPAGRGRVLMAVEAITWVLKRARGITSGPRCVLLVLANYSDAEGLCYPSVGHLSEMVEMRPNSVYAALIKLEDAGLITREKRPSGMTYRVHWTDEIDSRISGKRFPNSDKTDSRKSGKPSSLTQKRDTKADTKKRKNELGPPSWTISDYKIPDSMPFDTTVQGSAGYMVSMALQDWLDFRKLAKRKYLTSSWIAEIWNRVDQDPKRLVAAVRVSIAREWQGIYEDRNGKSQRHAAPAKVDPARRKIQTRRTS